jgi:hypothetical protein
MQDAINAQITREYYSSYLYLSMAAYFEAESLTGFAKWMRVQVQEENAHALIFFNYICDRGGKVELGAIEKPPVDFTSPLDAFQKTYEHEQKVTGSTAWRIWLLRRKTTPADVCSIGSWTNRWRKRPTTQRSSPPSNGSEMTATRS